MSKITAYEEGVLECLTHPDNRAHLILTKTIVNGVETATICWLHEEEGGILKMQPLAVIVNAELMPHLKPVQKSDNEVENVEFTPNKYEALKKVYDQTVAQGATKFMFDGHEWLVAYAKYVLEHLKNQFGDKVS